MSLSVYRGDTKTVTATFTQDGSAYDLTGYTCYFTVKNKPDADNTDSEALIQKEVTNAVGDGIVTFDLTSSDTQVAEGEYFYNIRIIDAGGNLITSTANNKFVVKLGATQKNS
jgi:hypothetical protein